MKNLEAIKTAGQENLTRLVDLGKQQPSAVKIWGVAAGAAVAGGLVVSAGAQGLVAIFATVASLPVALTVGAIGGGLLGWRYVERQRAASKDAPVEEAPINAPTPDKVAAEPIAAPEIVGSEAADEIAVIAQSFTEADDKVGRMNNEPVMTSEAVMLPDSELPVTSAIDDSGSSDGTILSEPLMITPEDNMASPTSELPAAELVDSAVTISPTQQDNLENIVGIGPVFANRLHAVNIDTFAQLAALTPERLLEIMAPSRGGHMIDAAAWIEQARKLAAKE